MFCGFPNAQLSEPQFFTQLGQTFMPGTPYMLQPLGLAAYLPGVLSNPPTGLPHEFALICYPSQSVWNAGMNGSLRGRIYNQTHGGVYAVPPSGAAFPILIDNLPTLASDPFFLFPSAIDWQAGFTHVIVGAKKDTAQTGDEFRTALRSELLARRDALRQGGIEQVVATARDAFAIIWMHGEMADLAGASDFLSNVLAAPIMMRNERTICLDAPPTVSINGSQAFNFVFLREAKYFLK
ncbi:MAG: hypothetical protein WA993_02900 [Candidatus Binatus sp.]